MGEQHNSTSGILTAEEYEAKLVSQLAGTARAMELLDVVAEALRLADVYLDGFVWTTEPEHSELRSIKAASKRAQRALRQFHEDQGDTARSLLARTAPVNVTVCTHCGGAGVEIAGGS